MDQALARLQTQDIDAVLLAPGFSDTIPLGATIAACSAREASVVLLLDQVARLGRLDSRSQELIDDFVLVPVDVELLGARLELVARRRRSESVRRATLRALPDMMFRIDENGTYIDFQAPEQEHLYVSADRIIGANITSLLPKPQAHQCMNVIRQVLATGEPGFTEYHLVEPEGNRYYEARMVRADDGEVVALVRDVTHRRRAEDEIRAAVQAKQAFASRVLSIQEAERQHLSRELHDSIGQLLLVHRMDAEWLVSHTDEGIAHDAAERLCSAIDDTLHLVRNLAMDLRPPAIDDLGLESALETLCVDLARRSGLRCAFKSDPNLNGLSSDAGVCLYRIAQEALTNAVRHARARTLKVSLFQEREAVTLSVIDDGVGIPPAQLTDAASFGLVGMRERAELVGGCVTIQTSPGTGTTIRATVPHRPHRLSRSPHQAPPRREENT